MLVPTRELARQVHDELAPLARPLSMRRRPRPTHGRR
jgi:superfamily II DNA/RNA helicase